MQPDFHFEHHLTRDELQALKNRRTGMTIFQISWIMVFVSLIVVNWQLRFRYEAWPPPGVEKLGLLLPTVATVALLISAVLARHALAAIQTERMSDFLKSWRVVMGLGVFFALIMVIEWIGVSFESQYGKVFRVMTGFHGTHALVIGGYMLKVFREASAGRFDRGDFWSVEAATKLWYFVTIAWIMFYLVLYWL